MVEVCKQCQSLKKIDAICGVCGHRPIEWHITLEDYIGPHMATYGNEWSQEHENSANNLLIKVNSIITEIKQHCPDLEFKITSGWRPASYNVKIGGALRSRHIICQAIDLADPEQKIGKYLELNQELLRSRKMAMEDLRYTVKKRSDGTLAYWVHLQSPPPRSGRVIFIPYPGPPPKV